MLLDLFYLFIYQDLNFHLSCIFNNVVGKTQEKVSPFDGFLFALIGRVETSSKSNGLLYIWIIYNFQDYKRHEIKIVAYCYTICK